MPVCGVSGCVGGEWVGGWRRGVGGTQGYVARGHRASASGRLAQCAFADADPLRHHPPPPSAAWPSSRHSKGILAEILEFVMGNVSESPVWLCPCASRLP